MDKKELTCESWLHGKHCNIIGEEVEINTKLPYVAIGNFFAQGEEASQIITEINKIYNKHNCSVLKACRLWQGFYL